MNSLKLIIILYPIFLIGQVGIGTTSPNLSSALHIESKNSGLLIPRLSETEKNLITNPAKGLLIYQTTNQDGFWYFDGTPWVPLLTNYDFENGVYNTGYIAKLGGNLTENTTISLNTFDCNITLNNTGEFNINSFSTGSAKQKITVNNNGDIIMSTDNNNEALTINANHDVVDFGFKQSSYDYVNNGSYMSDHTGMLGSLKYVASFDSGNYQGIGTTIGIGSVEFMTDGSYATYFSNAIMPFYDVQQTLGDGSINYMDLGASTHRWNQIYTQNGVITTSDKSLKTNIGHLNYGLKEILSLKPVTYYWKEDLKNNHEFIEKKIGFIAQDLLKVIPETVKTHSYSKTEDGEKNELVKNKYLGVKYHELIPVLVKAIQEQQEDINLLKQQIKG